MVSVCSSRFSAMNTCTWMHTPFFCLSCRLYCLLCDCGAPCQLMFRKRQACCQEVLSHLQLASSNSLVTPLNQQLQLLSSLNTTCRHYCQSFFYDSASTVFFTACGPHYWPCFCLASRQYSRHVYVCMHLLQGSYPALHSCFVSFICLMA